MSWKPAIGACPEPGGVRFRVWAPGRQQVELVLGPGEPDERRLAMTTEPDGMFTVFVGSLEAGSRYKYRLDGEGPFPDPASRYQPDGVHGPSAVVDWRTFEWSDDGWPGVALEDAVIYELHVGTFTPAGTFAGAAERLPYLAELGVTVVELMPVADFPGGRNWGYDGVSLFAPSRAYGTPDDLRSFVDAAHGLGLAVILDVVYNHFGPDGAYASAFSPSYQSTRHRSPWGAAVNLDGPGCEQVRAFLIENAGHWLHEYHLDGLRLDATHALVDDSPRHVLAELADRVRRASGERRLLLTAEDDRNLAAIVRPAAEGGWGLDAVWADDFHHQVRRLAAGDRDGYYEDYTGTIADLTATIEQGWFFRGQHSVHQGRARGTDPAGIPLCRMIVCLQNHDQIGNRPFGERLNHQIAPALFRTLSALLLFVPETPLIFMGQEWAATARFLYFTDHHAELGRLVTEGRREEFSRFEAFSNPENRRRIPDPQAVETFNESRLRWDERLDGLHAATLALYRALIELRRTSLRGCGRLDAVRSGAGWLALLRKGATGGRLLVSCLSAPCRVDLRDVIDARSDGRWTVALSTDEARFRSAEPGAGEAGVSVDPASHALTFTRPASVILQGGL